MTAQRELEIKLTLPPESGAGEENSIDQGGEEVAKARDRAFGLFRYG